ncbi:MAG TPA: S-layer homology domain-containing protein [Acidimicrobiia bacterium]|jgi:hypothetical protein
MAEDLGRPYATDPIAPYFGVTSSWAVSDWKVYACDTGQGHTTDVDEVADVYNTRVGPVFARASKGRYVPEFTAGGVLKGGDVADCRAKAKGDAVIVLYADRRVGGVLAHGVPPSVTIENGKLSVAGRPSVVVGSRSGTADGAGLVAHEIGHTLGWPHVPLSGPSHPLPGVSDYANLTNLMSSGDSVAAWNRYVVGWSQALVHRSTRKYRLEAPGEGNGDFVIIPGGEPGAFYTVAAGSDGVEIHWVDQQSSARAACRSQKRQGFPVCFGTGTEIRAIAPPPDQSDTLQPLPPWTPRTIGWRVGQTETVGSVSVHVIDLVGEPGAYRAATVEIRGDAPKLWSSEIGDTSREKDDTGPGYETNTRGTAGSDDDRAASSISFVDITRDDPSSGDIAFLVSRGITKGCNPPANDRFCPDEPVTRGQMAAFLVRALSLPAGSTQFSDTRSHVFAADVAALANAGITRGCNPPSNDRFCPDEPVTRGQMAAFLVRALGLAASHLSFVDTAGHTFAANISALAAAGITRGCNPPANDRFCPDDYVTRAQMAAFLRRAVDR